MVRIMPPSHIQIWGLSSAHFDFGKSIRKSKSMVQLQVAMSAIAKSRLSNQTEANPRLNGNPRYVHLNCTLMAL